MKTRFVGPVLGAVLAVLAAAPLMAADAAKTPAAVDDAPTVSVVTAARAEISAKVIVTGTLVAREQVYVSPGVDGLKIESILADAGDTVTAGQVLARLAVDTIDVQLAQNASQLASSEAQIAQSAAQITSAEASAKQANAALERAKTLTEKGVSAQDILDQRVAAADAANAQLAVARQALTAAEAGRKLIEAQRAELELRRSKTDITAPRGGLVLSRSALVGQVAASGNGALFVIAEDGKVELDAEATETVLPSLKPGQSVAVTPAGVDMPIEGTVRLVMPEVDSTTRLGRLRVALPVDPRLRVGAFARGTVEVARSIGVILPVSAVTIDREGSVVQVVKDGVIETRKVETGLTDAGRVEITSGIAEGEVVVARAGTFLRAGDKVKAEAVPAEEAKG